MTGRMTAGAAEGAITVAELNRTARELLEQGLGRVWVEGEVSNLVRPASGHVYFSLKDASAQLRCAWFRQRQRGAARDVGNGDHVLALGRVSIYEARGDYQLIVERVEPAGEGALRQRFEALKARLAAEGLFDEAAKRHLPTLPRRIGVVTSPSGAALRDVLSVLRRRFPAVPVVVYPTAVQGESAAGDISEALARAERRAECDVLILCRGGGSLEDLWPFNEEAVARAIHAATIPIVSGVGHEIDMTIADFAADLRAPTPSGAAELVVPDQGDWSRRVAQVGTRIALLGRRRLDDAGQATDFLAKRLTQASPVAVVGRQRARLDNLRQLMAAAMRHDVAARRARFQQAAARLSERSPRVRLRADAAQLASLDGRLRLAVAALQRRKANRLAVAERGLSAMSPLATLARGYAIVTDAASGKLVTRAADVAAGTAIEARLANGSLAATVTDTMEGEKDRATEPTKND